MKECPTCAAMITVHHSYCIQCYPAAIKKLTAELKELKEDKERYCTDMDDLPLELVAMTAVGEDRVSVVKGFNMMIEGRDLIIKELAVASAALTPGRFSAEEILELAREKVMEDLKKMEKSS